MHSVTTTDRFELHTPPNTVITGEDGRPVTQVSITPIPVDRPPFPLPTHFTVPVYFTVQPGGAYVHTAGSHDGATAGQQPGDGGGRRVDPADRLCLRQRWARADRDPPRRHGGGGDDHVHL